MGRRRLHIGCVVLRPPSVVAAVGSGLQGGRLASRSGVLASHSHRCSAESQVPGPCRGEDTTMAGLTPSRRGSPGGHCPRVSTAALCDPQITAVTVRKTMVTEPRPFSQWHLAVGPAACGGDETGPLQAHLPHSPRQSLSAPPRHLLPGPHMEHRKEHVRGKGTGPVPARPSRCGSYGPGTLTGGPVLSHGRALRHVEAHSRK